MELEERAGQLAQQVIRPLVLGGSVEPIRPFGTELAAQVGEGRRMADDQLRAEVDHARTRQARRIVAVDVLPDLSAVEWTIAAALNDLLQVGNEELSGIGTRNRHATLLRSCVELCQQLPAPTNLHEAVARHGTFRNVLDLRRTDVHVSWWTGSAVYRGQAAPGRLLRWPRLRRVNVQEKSTPLAEMAAWAPVDQNEYQGALSLLMGCTPLTDLATADRPAPAFVWTAHTLAVVATHPGCNLALRAFAQHEPSTTVWSRGCERRGGAAWQAFQQATARLPQGSVAQKVAAGWVQTFGEAVRHWTERVAAA